MRRTAITSEGVETVRTADIASAVRTAYHAVNEL